MGMSYHKTHKRKKPLALQTKFCVEKLVLMARTKISQLLYRPKSLDGSVSIATDYGLDDQMMGVRIPGGGGGKAGNFSRHRVQTGSGAHPASYPMGTAGSFPAGKAAGAWSWPLTSI
jgi:hypothetical protein